MIKLINVLKVIVEGIHIKDDKYVVDYDKNYLSDQKNKNQNLMEQIL